MTPRRRLAGLVLTTAALSACAAPPAPAPTAGGTPSPTSTATRATWTSSPTRSTTPAPTPVSCTAVASQMDVATQVGQLFMLGVQVGTPTAQVAAAISTGKIGSVVLLGQRSGLEQVQGETSALNAQFADLLIAADQEGGQVQRLSGPGFATIPSASQQGQLSTDELRGRWQRYARELRNAGVRYDLAPVADVVPADQRASNQAIGQLDRGYGSDAGVVAEKVSAVIEGLSDGRVASAVKHFPGLGQVPQNTDLAVGRDEVSKLSDAELAPFSQAIKAGANSVMVSSAIYTQVDAKNPAVFSADIITGILRTRMGFSGVIISDDLGAAKSVAEVKVDERAIRFFSAGGDLLISADAGLIQQMITATIKQAGADAGFAAALTQKVARVLKLKQAVGLASCE